MLYKRASARTLFLFTLIFMPILHVTAQKQKYFDLASFGTGISKGDNIYQSGTTRLNYTYGTVKAPLVQENGDIFLVGITAQWNQMHSPDSSWYAPQIVTDKSISYGHTGLIAGYVHALNANIKLNLIAIPYIASDLDDVSSEDFRADIITLFVHKKTDRLTYKYGILYANSFAGQDFWPLLGLDWTPPGKSSVAILLPQYMRYKFQATKRLDFGTNYNCQLATYRMSEERQSIYVEQQLGQITLSSGLFLSKNLYVQVFGGYSVVRYADFYQKNDTYDFKVALFANKERSPLSSGYHNGSVAELKISYLIPID